MMPRKFASISCYQWQDSVVYLAVATDGTAWETNDGGHTWIQVPPLPIEDKK